VQICGVSAADLNCEQAVQADVLRREVLAPHVCEHEDEAGAAEANPEERDQQRDHLQMNTSIDIKVLA
jgi:phage-related protein